MQYMCLIYVAPDAKADAPDEAIYAEYSALAESAGRQGVMKGGDELADATSATTVRVRDGKRVITDGPFAETKEVLVGYFTFECPTIDEAIEWAAKIPGARYGSIEVRPIVDRGN
jgi:hypothetical protein